ncbi:MAG: hypothetical protein R3F62_05675 [Planctomycetota bacterium]
MTTTHTNLPTTYAGLCEHFGFPRRIRSKAQRERAGQWVMALARRKRNAEQDEYLVDLAARISTYDAPSFEALVGRTTPAEALALLCEEHGLSGADLSRILGDKARTVGPRLLSGKRAPSKAHIKTLAEYFHCSPAVFL